MPTFDLYDFPRRQLEDQILSWGFRPPHAARLWKYLYHQAAVDLAAMRDLPPKLRHRLQAEARLAPLPVSRATSADDGLTRKYLLALHDGATIETVLMQPRGRTTACLSSQAGCPLDCAFCATGQAGFTRNLSTGEIVAQALHVDRVLRGIAASRQPGAVLSNKPALRNIVVMGMGEPLLNYDATLDALDILRDSAGLAIAAKRITLSTVGVAPGIVRLADQRRPFSLAVSLHAANQAQRAAIVPAARAWPLDELLAACRYYATKLDRRIFFEWTLIAGGNDSPQQAHELADLLRGLPAQVNLIPLNSTAGFAGQPVSPESLERFRATLREHGIPVSVRYRRGLDIAAGCGQLAAT